MTPPGVRRMSVDRDAPSVFRCDHTILPVQCPGSSSWAMAGGRPASTGHRGGANGAGYIWPWHPVTADISAVEVTPSCDGDSPALSVLLGQIPQDAQIGKVTALLGRLLRKRLPGDGRLLPHAPTSQGHHRPASHPDHPDPKQRACVEGRLSSRRGPQREPVRHPIVRTGVPETLDRFPRPKLDRGEDALPEILRGPFHGVRHCRSDQWREMAHPGLTDRRDPHPHSTHEPLQRPRHRRDRPRGMTSVGEEKSRVTRELCKNAGRGL